MVIDVHIHAFPSGLTPEERAFRHRVYQLKEGAANTQSPIALTGKPSGGNAVRGSGDHAQEDFTLERMRRTGIDRLVLLPLDYTTTCGGYVGTNEQVRAQVDYAPDRFIGFASVDPHRPDALEVLEYAFGTLKLSGLKLHPSKQEFYPADPMMDAIYKKCIQYNKPITFHAGLSWEPDCLSKYAMPINFEEVAVKYPELRFSLAHFGWPWVVDTAMLILKYPNVYTDTAAMYMDSPPRFMDWVFNQAWGPLWYEHNFPDKVMFGSNRFGSDNMKQALLSLKMRDDTRAMLLGGNAVKFLGLEG